MYLFFNKATTENNSKEWEIVLLSTLSIILEESTLNKQWCLILAGSMFDELIKIWEQTKIITSEMFLMVKIISYVAAFYDIEELTLTKKLLHFIFQSLLKMSFDNTHVSFF